MSASYLEPEDHTRDAEHAKALHGRSEETSGLLAFWKKDRAAFNNSLSSYEQFWNTAVLPTVEEDEQGREQRKHLYATLTREYYNLSTDLYEYGVGSSFHFCRFSYGEPYKQAIARHEHFLAHMTGVRKGMTILDVGCGVGGPASEIARFTGAHVVGINNNDYQIQRAVEYTRQEGVIDACRYVKGDFMHMPFPADHFDAVYAIEATVHAPSLDGIYKEIHRVLKPSGRFGVYEWVMTDLFDGSNAEHRSIRANIEQGNGISSMSTSDSALQAMLDAGFEVEVCKDLAVQSDSDVAPWYWTVAGEWKYIGSLWDVSRVVRMTKLGRSVMHGLMGLGEVAGLVPRGTQRAADNLALAADSLVAGGKQGIFTPMLLMVGRKS